MGLKNKTILNARFRTEAFHDAYGRVETIIYVQNNINIQAKSVSCSKTSTVLLITTTF